MTSLWETVRATWQFCIDASLVVVDYLGWLLHLVVAFLTVMVFLVIIVAAARVVFYALLLLVAAVVAVVKWASGERPAGRDQEGTPVP